MAAQRDIDLDGLAPRVAALPGFEPLRAAALAGGEDAHLVGGAVRDALLGGSRADLDVIVAGDPAPLARALGGDLRSHDRFATATATLPGSRIDIARARSESYPHPGALPEVSPAPLELDLGRRDFTINAMAVPLADTGQLIDLHGGLRDLAGGILRTLHKDSFLDDPTRALRAARYASRLGLQVEPRTLAGLRATDLSTVSADRIDAELRRLASEPRPRAAFELLAQWGLVVLPEGAGALVDAVGELLERDGWCDLAEGPGAVIAASRPPSERTRALAALRPASASAAAEAARGHDGVELLVARALGADWLDRYVVALRGVRLEISGDDLIEAGVEEGPAIGRGLRAALRAKLDGEAEDREAELRIALAAAGEQP